MGFIWNPPKNCDFEEGHHFPNQPLEVRWQHMRVLMAAKTGKINQPEDPEEMATSANQYVVVCWDDYPLAERSLEVKLLTIWTDGKAEMGRVREEKRRREKIRAEKESEERRCRCAKR